MDNLFPFNIGVTDPTPKTIVMGLVMQVAVNTTCLAVYALTVCLVIKAVL